MKIRFRIICAMCRLYLTIFDATTVEFLTIYHLSACTPISSAFANHVPCIIGINLLNDLRIQIDNARDEYVATHEMDPHYIGKSWNLYAAQKYADSDKMLHLRQFVTIERKCTDFFSI